MTKRKIKKPKSKKIKSKELELRETLHRTRIRVIGIGGGGSSIVSEIAPQLKRIDFVAANTDLQALKEVAKEARVFPFGQNLTHGLGCGMDPRLSQKAVGDEKQKIAKLFKGIDLVILVSCLGGGTGSGASPEFAKIARDLGVMTLGIFTLPFKFEGAKRTQIARASLEKLIPNLNAVSIVPNENIFRIIDKNTPIVTAFSAVNKRLSANLRGLIEMIYLPGLINIDFADLKTVMEGKGKLAYLNAALSQGSVRAEEALKEVLKSPLNEYNIRGAEKILFNITAPADLRMKEVEQISRGICDFNRRAKIIFGVSQDNSYKDKLRIILLAVGCGKEPRLRQGSGGQAKPKPEPQPQPQPQPEPEEPKPQPKPRPKKRKKIKPKFRPKIKVKIKPNPSPEPEFPKEKVLTRKNALDLKKEAEKTEQDLLEQEKKWDIPAFLRRQEN